MKKMKIWRLAFAMLAAFSLASCSSDDEGGGQEYQPAHRSAIFNDVKLVLADADGNDLGSQTETFSSLKIYGEQSKQYASTQSTTEDGLTYIKFKADLPDERDIKYNADKSMGTGMSTMTITVNGKTARLTFAFETTSNGEKMYGGNGIHIIGAQLDNKAVVNEDNGDMVIVLVVDEGGLTLSNEVPIPEEATATNLIADTRLTDKVYLGSGYDVTGAYLSNGCLRENVIDLSTFDESDQPKIAAFSGTGSLVSGVDNAWGFLNGLRVAQGFTMEGEPGDVYFAGTFTDNPLFKEASERGDDYKFLMYIDRYIVYRHQLNMTMYPSNAYLERILTDEFKRALAEESAESIVERFGTHVLMKASMGLSILSLYRSGLKANTRDEDRFTASMFRRMKEVYHPIFWGITDSKATKGGALAIQCHGGNTQRLAAALARFPLTFEVSSAAIADWWNKSSEEKSDLSLAHLQEDDLIPIYKLIPDETKRAEVQRAVKAYIHNHQLN
ncbi:MAG: hypothetical protein IJ020_07005 [Bacteroidaceae bacterium]|nr:hypothetical protein [Bacteroidaceae bacterium]